jgi:hypothetical protein
MGEGRPVRDRSFKFPVSVDARNNARIWDEAVKKEQKFFWNNKTPAQAAAERGAGQEGVKAIRDLREKLEGVTADYLWETAANEEAVAAASSSAPRVPEVSAMAELAMGVPDAESGFLRPPKPTRSMRVARTLQHPTMMPWQLAVTDPCFVPPDALKSWKANQHVLQLPPPPVIPQRSPATISGNHAASLEAWRRSEVPLSQWELSERGESLVNANQLAEHLAGQRARAQLAELLNVTERVSRTAKPMDRAKWFER